MTSGVYHILCRVNGKVYIGISANIEKRLHEHLNGNSNESLNADVSKYNKTSFRTKILKKMSKKRYFKEQILVREIEAFYIKQFDSANPEKGYNTQKSIKHIGKVIEIVGRKVIKETKK